MAESIAFRPNQDVEVKDGHRWVPARLRRFVPGAGAWYAETERGVLLYDLEDIRPVAEAKGDR